MKRERTIDDMEDVRRSPKRRPTSENLLDAEDGASDAQSGSDDEPTDEETSKGPLAPKQKAQPQMHRQLPSAKELKTIFEASELFKSNAFKLQIDQLLQSITPKSSKPARAPLEAFLLKLHDHLQNIPSLTPAQPAQAAAKLKEEGISVPFPSPAPTEEANWKFEFMKPAGIAVVGSWALNMCVKRKDGERFTLDLVVEMPSEMLQEKDYLNDRFFHKRALYLAHLAMRISKEFQVELEYGSTNNDVRQTALILTPKPTQDQYDFTKLYTQVRVLLALPSSSPIPTLRLNPTSSNLRISGVPLTTPTPIYNNALALQQTALSKSLLVTFHTFALEVPHFVDAVKLLRVWANQRGFGRGTKWSVRGFEDKGLWWAAIIVLLVHGEETGPGERKKRKTIGKGLSSYQFFRAALDFLSFRDFGKEPVFMKLIDSERKVEASDWRGNHPAVFVDPSGSINFLSNTPIGSLRLLREEAAQTLRLLNDSTSDTFTPVFLKDLREPQARFDVILRVNLEGVKMRQEDRLSILESGSYVSSVLSRLDRTLLQALGDRVRAIAILHPSSTHRPLSHGQPTLLPTVDVGLILDPKQAFRLVDHGPRADEDEQLAQTFREFWGGKSELRRFKDGSIQESVVWEVNAPTERVHIPLRIVEHVIHRHFGIKKVESVGSSYDALLAILPSIGKYRGIPESTSGFRNAMQAFEELTKGIKAMDLPLSLVSCTPVAEGLRYTSAFSPVPIPTSRLHSIPECAQYLPVHEAILMFEKSSKWPDDLGAIQKLKLAWFESLARLIVDKFDGSKAEVLIEDGPSPIEDNTSLEVLLPEGHAFRLRVYHDRERTLLERKLDDKTVHGFDRQEAQMALDVHIRRFIHGPLHHAAIMNMHHRYTGWSPSVRLVKRWCAAHMLSLHICPEVIELLVAHVFLRADAQPVPHTGPSGFVRTLDFIRTWDWKGEPLIVPLYAAAGLEDPDAPAVFQKEKYEQAKKAFKESRTLDPGMSKGAWFIATEEDLRSTVWTGLGRTPTPMIADRLRMLAKASHRCLERGMEVGNFDIKTLFLHPLEDYDFQVHLNPTVLPRYVQNLAADETSWTKRSKYANIAGHGAESDGKDALLDFDPAIEFVQDLQRIYGDTIALFYDQLGGTVIAGSWNPLVRQAKPFRAMLGYSTAPAPGKSVKKGQVVFNEDGVLAEIARMGRGMVKEVVKRG